MSVDLPAPFCPISACTSPADTESRAWRNAPTPPKLMSMSCISSSGGRVMEEDPDCDVFIACVSLALVSRDKCGPFAGYKRSDGALKTGRAASNTFVALYQERYTFAERVRSIAVLHALRHVAFIVEAVGDFHPWRDCLTLRELLRKIASARHEQRARRD